MHSFPRLFLSILFCFIVGCKQRGITSTAKDADSDSADGLRHLVVLGTNDIHGGLEGSFSDGPLVGGMAIWDGIVRATRAGVVQKYGERGGVVVVDAGDQFQGTIVSNSDEGLTMHKAMAALGRPDPDAMTPPAQTDGYDAAIPGNHAFDFGPIGWDSDVDPAEEAKVDKAVFVDGADRRVQAETEPPSDAVLQARRGALIKARLPFRNLISGNIYDASSLVDAQGEKVPVESVKCRARFHRQVDWSKARRSSFFTVEGKPYIIAQRAGVRVALIGIDTDITPATTVAANLLDFCFRDQAEAYLDILRLIAENEAEDPPKIFIMMTHDAGDGLQEVVKKILKSQPDGVHAVIAGHTHKVEKTVVDGVPIIQSGFGGTKFGRIELDFDPARGRVVAESVKAFAGLKMFNDRCDVPAKAAAFCADEGGSLRYDGMSVVKGKYMMALIEQARKTPLPEGSATANVAARIATINDTVKRDFQGDSALGAFIADMMREAAGADLALINSGSIRANFETNNANKLAGTTANTYFVTYEDLYKVIPFATRLVKVRPVDTKTVVAIMKEDIENPKTTSYGVLQQSGLKVKVGKRDGRPYLKNLATVDGIELYDGDAEKVLKNQDFQIVTTNYLLGKAGGAPVLYDAPRAADLGVLREVIASRLLAGPARLVNSRRDDRVSN